MGNRLSLYQVGLFAAAAATAFLATGKGVAIAAEEAEVLQAVQFQVSGPSGYDTPMQENGGSHEQGVVTKYVADGRTVIQTVYMSPDVPEGEEYWQCKCSSFELTEEGFKPLASNVQITHNVGGYRNCNRPAVAGWDEGNGFEGGILMTFGTDYIDPNNTSMWQMTLDKMCNVTIPQMKISTTDDNDTGGPHAATAMYDELDMSWKFLATGYYAGGGGSAMMYVTRVRMDSMTNELTMQRTVETSVYDDVDTARMQVQALDLDRAIYCGPYGDTRPPMMGINCAVVDTNTGQTLTEHLAFESKPNEDIYYNDPKVVLLDYGYVAVIGEFSNGAGRKTNEKGAATVQAKIFQITDQNEFILEDQQTDFAMPFQTHAAACSGMYGDPAVEEEHSFAILSGPPTGVGQGMLHTFKWTSSTGFNTRDEWIIFNVADMAFQSNMYGANPGNQGRNFASCIGNVENPGYGVEGGFMPTVKTFFVSTMSGKEPGGIKNSQFVAASPALFDPTEGIGPPSGSSGSGENGSSGGAEGPGEGSGACGCKTAGKSSDNSGTMAAGLLLVGLGLAAARRRREDA